MSLAIQQRPKQLRKACMHATLKWHPEMCDCMRADGRSSAALFLRAPRRKPYVHCFLRECFRMQAGMQNPSITVRQCCCTCADGRASRSETVRQRSAIPECSAQKALDALFLAAPVRGEVQPWVWLLRAVADTHQLDCMHDCICYLVGTADFRLGAICASHADPVLFGGMHEHFFALLVPCWEAAGESVSDAWLADVKQLLPAAVVDASRVGVQAKIVKSIAAEEEWLRLLVHELAPVIEHLHADELLLSKPSVIGSSAQGALL